MKNCKVQKRGQLAIKYDVIDCSCVMSSLRRTVESNTRWGVGPVLLHAWLVVGTCMQPTILDTRHEHGLCAEVLPVQAIEQERPNQAATHEFHILPEQFIQSNCMSMPGWPGDWTRAFLINWRASIPLQQQGVGIKKMLTKNLCRQSYTFVVCE